jgi:undecaprenyl diphosphate synthase
MIIPEHIAIIMDGNRRWARKRGLPAAFGHAQGSVALQNIVRAAAKFGVKTLTVYAFSTENWSRDEEELGPLLNLFKKNLMDLRGMMVEQGVRFETIGNLDRFPQDLLEELHKTKETTKDGSGIELILAMNYGGRDEICRAAKTILEDYAKGKFEDLNLTESIFARYLDTAKWKDPELFIRTSGEKRLSNFLLWQLSYAEVYITEVLWPDFDEKELYRAIVDFQKRERRCGK